MATTHQDARAMERLADRVQRVLAVGHLQRFLPAVAAAGAAIRAGRIGEVWAVDDYRLGDYRPEHNTPWFFDRTISGGGIMINLGAHSVDRNMWLTDSTVTAVTARLAHRFGSPVETDARVQLELSGGAESQLALSSDAPGRDAQLPSDIVSVVGDLGAVRIANGGAWLRSDGQLAQLWAPRPGDIADAFASQWRGVMAAIAGDAPPEVDGHHGAEVVQVIETVYQSAGEQAQLPTGTSTGSASASPRRIRPDANRSATRNASSSD